MYIEIPVLDPAYDDEDELSLRRNIPRKEYVACFNVDGIAVHYEDDLGGTIFKMSNGEFYRTRVKYKDFKDLINDIVFRISIKSNPN